MKDHRDSSTDYFWNLFLIFYIKNTKVQATNHISSNPSLTSSSALLL